jgi:hypothetical protein
MQIKNLKNDKKSLENKLNHLIKKKSSKSSNEEFHVVEKGTNTYPINITTQEDANPIEENTYIDFGVKMMENSGVLTNINSTNNKATTMHEEDKTPKVNQEIVTCTIRKSHATKTHY